MLSDTIIQKFKELEKSSEEFWNIPPEAGNFLSILIKSANYKNVLELGTSNGYSAIWLTNALKVTGGHLVSLEFWQKRLDLAEANLKECGLLDIATFKCGSALKLIDKLTPSDFKDSSKELKLDMVFIDANKGETFKYYNLVSNKIRAGGMLIADNVASHREKMDDFIQAIYENNQYQVQEFPFGGGLLVGLKIN